MKSDQLGFFILRKQKWGYHDLQFITIIMNHFLRKHSYLVKKNSFCLNNSNLLIMDIYVCILSICAMI